MSQTSHPLAYAQVNQARFVEELREFIRFPSVSAQPQHARDAARCAVWLANHLSRIGMEQVRVIPTQGHPLVYAQWLHAPTRPAVLIYGHYDVQPAEPLAQWRSPPFEPTVRGNDLYGRGASDDKGQLLVHVKALESYLRTNGTLPVNVKCLFEGEEEIGSRHLTQFVRQNRRALAADVAVVSDSSMPAPEQPAITYAMRGMLSLELQVTGPKSDLHDGVFGGAVHNPSHGLCEIIAGLHDGGSIAIPGFYDRVRQVAVEERAYMASAGPIDKNILRDAGADKSWGERGYSLYERTTIRPALTVNGITAGYQGPGTKSIIPAKAVAKLNFRLVPDQDPFEVEQLVRKRIAELTQFDLHSTIQTLTTAPPVLVNRRQPFIRAAAWACGRGFGATPVFVRNGGTNPAVGAFHDVLDLPTALLGFALPNDRLHAPNEKFHLPNFHKGIATSIWFLSEAGAMQTRAVLSGRQRSYVRSTEQ